MGPLLIARDSLTLVVDGFYINVVFVGLSASA
jgi:hypothetical protein